ncbi:alpha/beta hydrolase [Thalassotalea euphylliae]|uniref:alpha/beta hydrolase n=1 Tax=Thalassotalea euphylliae TaxID=1655234 RepID=UPI00362D7DA3
MYNKKMFMSVLCVWLLLIAHVAGAVSVTKGSLHTVKQFSAKQIPARDIHVWLPPNFDESQRYPVLYMHDGQMLFDEKATWNGQEWGVDEVAGRLIERGVVKPFIVVGINNADSARHSEYFPQQAFIKMTRQQQIHAYKMDREPGVKLFSRHVYSDKYLQFIVNELKPYIDQHYPTIASKHGTFVMGSSMGGLISLYAISKYPEIFGGAACLSTHWLGLMPHKDNPAPDALIAYFKDSLPAPGHHKLYFDYGDKTLDKYYPPLQRTFDQHLDDKGFKPPLLKVKYYPGHAHTENAWRSRLDIPLMFLFAEDKS